MKTYRVIVSYRVTHEMFVDAENKEEAEKTAINDFPLEEDLNDDVIDTIEGAVAIDDQDNQE